MNLNYRINRFQTKRRLKRENKKRGKAFSLLNLEQKRIFNLVKDLAKNNNEAIKFDPKTDETLIVLPHLLVVLRNSEIQLLNTNGFYTEKFPWEVYDYLETLIVLEGHRHRRKLKQGVKDRINEFLDSIMIDSENNLILETK